MSTAERRSEVVAEAPHEEGRELTILYATETGNAEEVAERIARIAYRRHIQVRLYNIADYDKMELINETHVIFVVSTTGNGEFPVSARPFWRFLLRSTLPGDILSDLAFATFGLGDSTYARFCWAARMLHARLKQLGAHPWMDEGEGDDQHYLGFDTILLPWLDELKTRLDEDMPMPEGMQPIPDTELLPPRVRSKVEKEAPAAFHDHATLHATLVTNERMTAAEHWQDVRLLELDLDENASLPAYRAGDVVALMPENDPEEVEKLLERLGWTDVADQRLLLTNTDPHRPLPPNLAHENEDGSLTLRRLLTAHLDPFSVPRKSFFEAIAPFSPADHREREKLEEYLQPGEGTDDMYEYAQRVRRSMAEVLYEFTSVALPVEQVMNVFPVLRERQFSIASGPTLAIALVKYKTRLQKPREGICSAWITRLDTGVRLPLRIVPGTLLVPANAETPIITIGPGTGIAPLRAIVQERIASTPPAHDNLVIIGCRYAACDFLFRNEWETLAAREAPSAANDADSVADAIERLRLSSTPLIELHVAASRDQENKIYVQDVLRKHGEKVWSILGQRRGIAYLSGSSGRMPEQVRQAMLDIFQEHGKMDDDQAARYLMTLEAEHRWQEECW